MKILRFPSACEMKDNANKKHFKMNACLFRSAGIIKLPPHTVVAKAQPEAIRETVREPGLRRRRAPCK
jgi:hypothetical protein